MFLALHCLQTLTLAPESSSSYITLMALRLQEGQVPRLLLGVSRRGFPRWALDMVTPVQNQGPIIQGWVVAVKVEAGGIDGDKKRLAEAISLN